MKTINKTIAIVACLSIAFAVSACGKLNPKTQGQINSALQAQSEDFQKCYENALEGNRDLQGDVDLVVKFDPKGKKPESVKVAKSAIEDKDMMKCVSKAADKIRIEDAPGVFVEGQYTVNFQFK